MCCSSWGHNELDTTWQLNNNKSPAHYWLKVIVQVSGNQFGQECVLHDTQLNQPWMGLGMYIQSLDMVFPQFPTCQPGETALCWTLGRLNVCSPGIAGLSVTDEAEDHGSHSQGGSCPAHAQGGALIGCLSAFLLKQSGRHEMRCKGRKPPGLNKGNEGL